MESIFDLPAHPLFVHFPIVLMPLVAAATLAVAARPSWRPRYGIALSASALVVAVATILAAGSGGPFNELLPIGDAARKHRNLGETTRSLTIVFFVATVIMAGFDRWAASAASTQDRAVEQGAVAVARTRSSIIGLALGAISAALAVLATIWMIRTGHEGARITWKGVLPEDG